MKMKTLAGLIVVSVLLGACGYADVVESTTPSISIESFEDYYNQELIWNDCDIYFECTTVLVPLDYADPLGPTIEIAVSRHLAELPGRRLGAIFMNPGGPGGSGIDYLQSYEYQFSDQLIDRFDLIGFDPRGVNQSSAVECFTDAELDAYAAADATPDTEAEIAEYFSSGTVVDENCYERSGELLAHVSTLEAAKDMDILRAVMGETKLNYLGKSYGTQLGAVYATLFPANVGAFVLDGAVDFTLPTRELALGQAKGFDLAINRFAEYCVSSAIVCDLGDSAPEIVQKIQNLLTELDQNPMQTMDSNRNLTEAQAWTAILGAMYVPDGGWDWLIEGLSLAFRGKGYELLNISDWFWGREVDGYADNSTDANIAINCADFGDSGITPLDIEAEFMAAAPITGRVLAWSEGGCSTWPVEFGVLPQELRVQTSPILVIGTTYDPATPDTWAQSLAAKLGVGIYINYNGDGHTAYMSGSTKLNNAVDAFFIEGTVPAPGSSFEPDWPMID